MCRPDAEPDEWRTRPIFWIALLLVLVPVGCGSHDDCEPVSFHTVDTDPDWSPDGGLIAFASRRRLGGIFVVEPGGEGMRRLFRGNSADVDWSPDGHRIAFQGGGGIYIMRRDGRRPRRILGRRFSLPARALDGRKLAVVKNERDLSTGIYVVRPDGTGLRRLPSPYLSRSDPGWSAVAASETEPAWRPDGSQITFRVGDGRILAGEVAAGRRRLIATGGSYGRYWRRPQSLSVVGADGSDLRKLTHGGSVVDDPGWRGDRATP